MRMLTRSLLPLLLFGCVAIPAFADSTSGHCVKIRAEIIDAQVTVGCTSPNDFCTAGDVFGNHGLNGTTYFVTDSAINGPSTAPGTIAASGLLVYTTRRGTLTVRESGLSFGTFFANFQEVQSGTGEWAGTTGHLWVNGQTVGDHFDSKLHGELCSP